MKAYHYSSERIERIDFDRCENGFWATSISPEMLEEHAGEIGFNDCKYCMVIEINDDADFCLVEQNSAKEEIEEDDADYGVIRYSNENLEYEDYVFFTDNAIKNITLSD